MKHYRRRNSKRGFSMMELAISLTIVTVLSAVAIGGYAKVMDANGDVQSSSYADRVIFANQTVFRGWGSYTPYGQDLKDLGPDLTVLENGKASTTSSEVSIAVGESGNLGVATRSDSGTCTYLLVGPVAGGGDKKVVTRPGTTPCSGVEALDPGDTSVTYTLGGSIKDQS